MRDEGHANRKVISNGLILVMCSRYLHYVYETQVMVYIGSNTNKALHYSYFLQLFQRLDDFLG